ncbi:hypothetical protein L596_023486 [Steinernema carpocapsae]|uniref:Uncharacterized protein n=1 Tax=Steinernema carpocapsae TaxID=34508 RepID=A0A4U5MDU5_STECR|nr:hypothetical protein L596_023486 [Steinernema carpocapsae]
MILFNTNSKASSVAPPPDRRIRLGSMPAVVICSSFVVVCSALCLISDCSESSRMLQNRWLPVNICIYILGFLPLTGLFIAVSKSYEERISEIQRNNEGEEERWQEETAKIHRQHQLKCAELDGKLADASEQVEKLKKDKRKLEATLNEDEATKIKTLSAEIQSLNMALEMKSEEMKDMRQKNATLLLRVEEIPCKEQEIQKLKYKVRECTQEISRLRETEKTLTNEYEDLQRSAKKFVAKSEQIAKENDLLRYRMEEQAPLTQSLMETPVRFRSARPGGFSASMSAAIPTRNTQSTYGDLMGSTEELQRSIISMYQSRGRPQSCNVDTIYAPEGTYEGDTFEEDENTHLEHERCMKAVIDSGIGLAQHH